MNRRQFLSAAASSAFATRLPGQMNGAHASVAEMERAHILAEAKTALAHGENATSAAYPDGLREVSADVAALTAAFVLAKDEVYSECAVKSLRERYLNAEAPYTLRTPGVIEWVPLAELARATSFLADVPSWKDADRSALADKFRGWLEWLNAKGAQRWRDAKNHDASAWLLLSSALARAVKDEKQLEANRLLFKKPTLRVQIDAAGRFPQEAATFDPLRNTLMNFDLLAGCAQLLSTPFEDLWDFELIEGIGMRVVASALYPLLADVRKWPLPADSAHFREVPLRRPGLLFAGRAYSRVEYVELFRSLPVVLPAAEIAYSVPIRQPLLWTAKAPHGL